MQRWTRIVLFAFLATGLWSGCSRKPEKRYELKGKVVSVDKGQKQVTLAHEAIRGFMDAMTMPFDVRDEWATPVLEPGQRVEATLVVTEDESWIEGLRISKAEQADNMVKGKAPAAGDDVPDFSLVNQDDERIHLHQYRGRPLLLTFIYTRCPVPDYCPLTSKNFSDIYRALQSGEHAGKRPLLLTVSFDTENDTPAVLRDYAKRYMHPVNFADWKFAAGSPEEIKEITSFFGLSYWKESGQIVHSLVTALISPDGKIKKLYQGNRWKPADVLGDIEAM